ncbi:hypothetical protein [Pseudomonas sp.]|uniref:hypothetical protein n=1 Tax=Pseudomonas sp. TaxID=306 RepID=UPI002730D2A6|nr:hypothetical protein [Pseudomonas sp.]MDP2244016.1 hypothetical protein [Pseudomonas sp.]
MSLPKPDKEAIKRIRKARNLWLDDDNLFDPVRDAVLIAIGDGSISRVSADALHWWLEANPRIAALYPNSALMTALAKGLEPGQWTPEVEHDLLVFIGAFYLDTESIRDTAYDLLKNPPSLFGDLYSAMFGVQAEPLILTDHICALTGPFVGRTRRNCFEQILAAGGAPSGVSYYTDYLFVADAHIQNRVLSSSMLEGIAQQMRNGRIKILSESQFPPPSAPLTV